MSDPVEQYGLDPRFERAVVYMCCTNVGFFGRVGLELEPAAFADPSSKLLVETAQVIGREVGVGPSSITTVLQRLQRMINQGAVTRKQWDQADAMLWLAEDEGVPPEDEVVAELAPVLRRRREMDAIKKATSAYAQRGNYENVVELFQTASRIGVVDRSVGVRFGPQAFEHLARSKKMDRLPTGIVDLDVLLDGGPYQSTYSYFMMGAGRGKSMSLNQVTAHSMMCGQPTAVATLELPENTVFARVCANLTGIPINALLDCDPAAARLASERLADFPHLAPLFIKYFTAGATTTDDLEAWLKECDRQLGTPVRTLVVDYAGMLTAGKLDTPSNKVGLLIARGLRLLAVKRTGWVWSAEQPKSQNDVKKRLDTDDTAGSQDKPREADLVITGNCDDEDRTFKFFVAKNRHGEGRKGTQPCASQLHLGRVAPVARPPQSAYLKQEAGALRIVREGE